ncbi:NAD(P)/FAD-dependent oxidoreductase [Novilysobacter erysipheiresistens]|uniref:NADH:ubiquinone reductase (non-electrogenic) n=1 Tax=Novilysobacter erysipheiresistens TaxID=1749332 RepID=A0ABU7YXG5_9GAMM
MPDSGRQHHVVVVGGGFAGLWATRALAGDDVRITLVDRRNHHLFQPLLYQVATAGLSAPDIAAPLRHILRGQYNVEVRLGEVTDIDTAAHTVTLADGDAIGYDSLLLASGATHAYFGHDDWAGDAPGLKTLDDALLIRRRVLLAFERAEAADDPAERDAWLSFAVVGGGPTGVELAGTLAEIARKTLRREFRHIDPANARVRLVEAGARVLSTFPESLSDKARRQLEKLGVEVLTGAPVSAIDAHGFSLSQPDQTTRAAPGAKPSQIDAASGAGSVGHGVAPVRVAARTVLWAAGVAASPLGALLDAERDRAGRILVDPDLRVPGHPDVFVAGDLASVVQDGKPVPGVAPAAKQMGAHVAAAIRARLTGKPTPAFRYRDFGNLATIGRMAAVVHFGRLKLSGVLAWWFWLVVHIAFLIGFRNRLVVMLNWAWAYWSYQRHARIIFGKPDPPDDPPAL